MTPSQRLLCISKFINSRRVKNSVGRVRRFTPTSVSCTTETSGLLKRGLIICFATEAISRNSIAASTDCGTCIFISVNEVRL